MTRPLLALVVAALVAPAAAGAKEVVTQAAVCGTDGCTAIERPSQELAAGGDGIAEPAPAPQPYHVLRLGMDGAPNDWIVYWIGPASTVAYQGESRMHFERLDGAAAAAMRDATRGVTPHAAPRVVDAMVGGRAVADPASYLSLWTTPAAAPEPTAGAQDWEQVALTSAPRSPWTDQPFMWFSASLGALQRGAELVALPPELAAAARRGRASAGHPRESRRSTGSSSPRCSPLRSRSSRQPR